MGITMKGIAPKTGVSLVLNKKATRISEKNKQLIEAAAQELHYSPNQSAISFDIKKNNTIGFIIQGGTFYSFYDMTFAANLHTPTTNVSARFDRIARKIIHCVKNSGNTRMQTARPSPIVRDSTAIPGF
ncbi:MAG: hypothetical protein Pg6C_15370 [Treponemataceae bacterium]|nr:MAG: hypothetical protein Pg6C_15370 [Treponemataceae bacterium]